MQHNLKEGLGMLNINNLDFILAGSNKIQTQQWQNMLKDSFQTEHFTIDDYFYYSERLGIWATITEGQGRRYSNTFGKKDSPSSKRKTICEVNTLHEGVSKRVKGLYVIDQNNNIYLARKDGFNVTGPNSSYVEFLNSWPSEYSVDIVTDRETETIETVAIVAKLRSDCFHESLHFFLNHVESCKNQQP